MESYRFKPGSSHEKRRLLLPLSGGVSSLVLLHTLDTQLQKQLSKQNRTAYDLVVTHIHMPGTRPTDQWYEQIQQRFPTHNYLPTTPLDTTFTLSPALFGEITTALNIHLPPTTTTTSPSALLSHLLSHFKTPTSLTNITTILLHRLLAHLTSQHACSTLLLAHSDSTLASLTLSAVATGRGSAIAESIADGASPLGVAVNHPCRDLYKTELELYAKLQEPGLEAVEEEEVKQVSVRQMSIDELLKRYIEEQGVKYPSVMANVVRTVGKLGGRDETGEGEVGRCVVCLGRVEGEVESCYGCERMKQDVKAPG